MSFCRAFLRNGKAECIAENNGLVKVNFRKQLKIFPSVVIMNTQIKTKEKLKMGDRNIKNKNIKKKKKSEVGSSVSLGAPQQIVPQPELIKKKKKPM